MLPEDAAPALNLDFEPPRALPTGSVVAQRFSIIELIGHGGMGLVYKAQQIHMEHIVALKMLLSETSSASGDYRRFQREAQAASRLDHPNIVKIHDFGFADGQAYLCMDYIEGQSLEDMVKEAPLRLDTFRQVFKQACAALQHAHDKGMVHRDLKPSNLMLSSRGGDAFFLTVLDFGLVKMLHGSSNQKLTATDMLVGSPLYMSPEQCQCLNLDHRSDIYSLACVMYESLAGVPPLQAENCFDVMNKHVSASPVSIREAVPGTYVPLALELAIMKAMSKNPADRQQSMLELSEDIERSFSGAPDPVCAATALLNSRQDKTGRLQRKPRSPWKVVAAGFGILVSVLLLIASGMLLDELIHMQRKAPDKSLPASLPDRKLQPLTEGSPAPEGNSAMDTVQPAKTTTPAPGPAATVLRVGEQPGKEAQSERRRPAKAEKQCKVAASKEQPPVRSAPLDDARQASGTAVDANGSIRGSEGQASDLARLVCSSFNQRDYKATREYLKRFKEQFLLKPTAMKNEDLLFRNVLAVGENMPGGEDFDLSESLMKGWLEAFSGTNFNPTRNSIKMMLELSRLYFRMERRQQGDELLQEALKNAEAISEQALQDEIKAEIARHTGSGPDRPHERGFDSLQLYRRPSWGSGPGQGFGPEVRGPRDHFGFRRGFPPAAGNARPFGGSGMPDSPPSNGSPR
jgi:eukaryotic-like serine/threonine-protein kinase